MNVIRYILMLSLLFIITSCGVSEDCFKGKGNRVSQTFPIENFTKIKVYDGVGLVIKEGANYEVRIETSDNIIDVLDVRLNGDMLIVKDNSTCNVARDYGQTVVYVTSPNLEEIHSKTDQDIKSDGILNYPLLRLFSMDLSDGAGTGDFYINLESTGQFVIESNNVSNFYLNGYTNQLLLSFYFGNGRFYGENLEAEEIILFQRGSNDMIVKPLQSISGTIYATGNVILKNVPPIIEVEEVFTGRLIY
jgi:hypothetical protein